MVGLKLELTQLEDRAVPAPTWPPTQGGGGGDWMNTAIEKMPASLFSRKCGRS